MLLDNLEFMNWVGNLYPIVIYIFHCAFLTDLGYPRSKNPNPFLLRKEKSYSNVGTHKVILECEGSEAELASQTPTAKIILLNTG